MTRKDKALEFADDVYKIHVTGRHVEVTDSMKDYAVEKIGKLERLSDQIIDVWVTMDIQKLQHRVDVVMKVGHIKIAAHGSSDNMYASIDQATDKLIRQLRRYRERIRDHRAVKAIDVEVSVFEREPDEVDLINEEIEEKAEQELEKAYSYKLTKKVTRPLKTLTLEEAKMNLELSGDNFLLFKLEETNKLNVLYRRRDGNFGLIQPEG